MARTKSSVLRKEDDKHDKKKKDTKKPEKPKKTIQKKDSSGNKESSDSEDEMFTKMEKEEAGIAKFIKGTTWPVDTSVEVLVNYDAAKEIRKVKKEFWPLLFHMTRSDPRQMSNCICRSKVLLTFLKARLEQNEKIRERHKRGLISDTEIKSLGIPVNTNTKITDSPKKLRHTVTSSILASSITDLTDAKTEVLKLLTRVSLKRQDFAKLLVWIQKLKLCGREGAGRWGEVYVKDTTADSSTETADSGSDDDKKSNQTKGKGRGKSRVKARKKGNRYGKGRGRKTDGPRNWKVAMRPRVPTKDNPPEQEAKITDSKMLSPEISRQSKLQNFELKGKTLCKKEVSRLNSPDKKVEDISKCSIPLVDVVSVLDKRIIEKNKQTLESRFGRGRVRKNRCLGKEQYNEKDRNKTEDEDFVPNKKYRLSSGGESTISTDPEIPVPVCLYRAEEPEQNSSPIVEIDNVENGVCVPYEDRFVRKEAEVEQREMQILQNVEKEKQTEKEKNLPKSSSNSLNMSSSSTTSSSNSNSSRAMHLTPISQYAARLMGAGIVPNISGIVKQNISSTVLSSASVPTTSFPVPTPSTYNSITSTILSSQMPPLSSMPSTSTFSSKESQELLSTSAHHSASQMDVVTSNTDSTDVSPSTQETPRSSGSVQEALKIKIEQQSELYNKAVIPAGLVNISDGATVNFSQQSLASVHHEPSSSTNGNDESCTNTFVKQEVMDFVIIKNEEHECISLDDSDDEDSSTKGQTSSLKPHSDVDDQKEADPIIVIDD